MAYITQIRYCRRPIHWNRKTVLDVSHNDKLFSLWTAAAGAENGVEVSPASLQLDREQASILLAYLQDFLLDTPQNHT